MDMRTSPELMGSGEPQIEELSQLEQDMQGCTTYDELYAVIDKEGDVTIDSKDYESNTVTQVVYTVEEIKRSIEEVRNGERSIHDVCPLYRVKVLELLGTDREHRPVKIVITKE